MMQINGMRTIDSLTTVQRTSVQRTLDQKTSVQFDTRDTKTARAIDGSERTPVTVSQDGDTVWVSQESRARLEDDRLGKVTVKQPPLQETDQTAEVKPSVQETERIVEEKPPLQETERAAEESLPFEETDRIAEERPVIEDTDKEALIDIPVSTVGQTESDLRRMYLQGDISKNELDRAIEWKEERREALQEEDERISTEAVGASVLSDRQKMSAREMKYLFGTNSSDTPDPALRADVISKLENPPEKKADTLITGQVKVS